MLKLRAKLFGWAFTTERRKSARLSHQRWVQLALLTLLSVAILLRFWWMAVAMLLLFFGVASVYSWAKRNGYITFIPIPAADHAAVQKPVPDEKIPVRGTGRFLSGETESRLLFTAGELWLQPIGDLAIMLEPSPGRFKYQFIKPQSAESVRLGELSIGGQSEPALEITFMSDWIAPDELNEIRLNGDAEPLGGRSKKRTIFVSFNSQDDALRVQQTF